MSWNLQVQRDALAAGMLLSKLLRAAPVPTDWYCRVRCLVGKVEAPCVARTSHGFILNRLFLPARLKCARQLAKQNVNLELAGVGNSTLKLRQIGQFPPAPQFEQSAREFERRSLAGG
jgi:hypothetical protein